MTQKVTVKGQFVGTVTDAAGKKIFDGSVDINGLLDADVSALITAPVTPDPVEPPVVTPDPVEPPKAAPIDMSRLVVRGDTLGEARRRFTEISGKSTVDCDKVDGVWLCAAFKNPKLSDETDLSGWTPGDKPSQPSQPSQPSAPSKPSEPDLGAASGLPGGSLYKKGDLVVLEFDVDKNDVDDLHANIASRMVADYYGLERGTDYLVIGGCIGLDRPANTLHSGTFNVFNKTYGKEGSDKTWHNAYSDKNGVADIVARKMKTVLEAGKKVYFQCGGPMDQAALAVKRLQALGYKGNLKNIMVVQHSHGTNGGWNERNTLDANVRFLKNTINYEPIDNGNYEGNKTPGLKQKDNHKQFKDVDRNAVNKLRNHPVYGDAWKEAFRYFSPDRANSIDFSDTSEFLHILGLDGGDIRGVTEFVNKFTQTPAKPSTPSQPAPSTGVVTGGKTVRIQAEDANLGFGWVKETKKGGYDGSGYIRREAGNDYKIANADKGPHTYKFKVGETGNYRMFIRAMSIDPPRSDLNNDMWVKADGGKVGDTNLAQWRKMFVSGAANNWKVAGMIDLTHSKKVPMIQRFEAGKEYTLTIAGRSTDFAVDWIEFRKV